MHRDYETRLEKCKREATKQEIITCLDQASIDNNAQMREEFFDALMCIGIFVVLAVFVVLILNKVFG